MEIKIKYLMSDKFLLNNFIIIFLLILINNNNLIVMGELSYNNNNFDTTNKHFESVPTTIKTFENDTILLPCYLNAAPRFIRWRRDEVLLIDSLDLHILPPDRYHFWPNGSLQVSHVTREDNGEYHCEVMTSNNVSASQGHAIEVQYKPEVSTSPSGLFEVPEKSVFEIICEVRGVPPPVITWKRNGIEIQQSKENISNRRRLIVEVETRDKSGSIECVAENGVGEAVSAGIHLNILFIPEITVNTPVVHTKINMRTHLECIVLSAPVAKVNWFHHGVPIIPDTTIARHDFELQSNKSINHYYTQSRHQLVIKEVRDQDLGFYECRAENTVGSQGKTIEVSGRPMPCLFKSSPIQQMGTTHNLIWQTESLSPITEYKLKFRQVPSGNVTPQNRQIIVLWNELTVPSGASEGSIHTISYDLGGLRPASVYEVTVQARNRFGWSDNSKIVRFATGGEGPRNCLEPLIQKLDFKNLFPKNVELNYSTETQINYDEIENNFLSDPEDDPKVQHHTYRAGIGGRGYSSSLSIHKSLKKMSIVILILLTVVNVS